MIILVILLIIINKSFCVIMINPFVKLIKGFTSRQFVNNHKKRDVLISWFLTYSFSQLKQLKLPMV